MLILAMDTSGREGSIALAREAGSNCQVLEQVAISGGTYSAQLVPQLAATLERLSLSKKDIDLYVVVSGPGSFTGLRVGIATVKALADVFSRPLVEVSVLEAMAYAALIGSERGGSEVIAALDAQRSEIFAGQYKFAQPAQETQYPLTKVDEVLVSQSDFLATLCSSVPAARVISPDKSLLDVMQSAGVQGEFASRPKAGLIAEIGLQKFRAGLTVSPEALDANYIRRSDAELFSAPKLGIPIR